MGKEKGSKKTASKIDKKNTEMKSTAKQNASSKSVKKALPKKEKKKSDGVHIPVVSKSRFEILLLSSFQYPVNYDTVAAQTARYSGIFFVILGAVFTMVNVGHINGYYAHLDEMQTHFQAASVVCTDPEDPTTCEEEDPWEGVDPCSDTAHPDYDEATCDPWYGVDPCSDTAHPDYDPQACEPETGGCNDPNDPISYTEECGYTGDACDSPLHPDYDEAACEGAFSCDPESPVYDENQCGTYYDECDMSSPDYDEANCTGEYYYYDDCDISNPDYDSSLCSDTEFSCDTHSSLYDQERCTSGEYEENYVSYVDLVFNAPNADIGYVDMSTTDHDVVKGVIDVIAYTNDVKSLKLFMKDSSGSETKIATFSKTSTDKWKTEWDTNKYEDGEYYVYAEYVPTGESDAYEEGHEYVVISNHDYILDSTGEEGTLEILQESPLNNSVGLYIYTDYAEKVALFVDDMHVDMFDSSDHSNWEYRWDTTKHIDGEHKLYAKVYQSNGNYVYSETQVVEISNTEEDILDEIKDATPEVFIYDESGGFLNDKEKIFIEVEAADFVELYGRRATAITPQFIGLPRKINTGKWEYVWDTKTVPNGEYKLFARILNKLGSYDSERYIVKIYNEIVPEYTTEEEESISQLKDIAQEVDNEIKPIPEEPVERNETDQKLDSLTFNKVDDREKTRTIIAEFEERLETLRDRLARAIRNEDEGALLEIRNAMFELKNEARRELESLDLGEDLIREIDTFIDKILSEIEENTRRHEQIIRDRIGEAVFNDSDKDGISDYDEVNLYQTDPFSADSDGDGFDDGSEILGGFNPKDSTPEAIVQYESPQERGVVREDLLVVDTIETAAPSEGDDSVEILKPKKTAAIIKGKGLPNSFATLYIFSAPIVVTVKTGDDGSWSYTFDKELEDGEHEVYVGITDNAGKIVAKSNPLAFVKTAEAFSPVGAQVNESVVPVNDADETILTNGISLIVMSFIVVIIGLILILLGFHIERRTRLTNEAQPLTT